MSEDFELRFKLTLDNKNDLPEFFEQSARGAQQLQSNLSRALSQAGASLSQFANKAKSEFQGFAGKELGGSIGTQARGVLELRDAINKLAVSSGHGAEITGELKDQIQQVSQASNQLQGDVTEALQAFVERTGDLDTARKNLSTYAKVATATTAALTDIAQVGVDLKEKLDISDQARSFGVLAAMAKAGAIELRDLARIGPRIFNVAQGANVSGEGGLREVGALAEVYAKGVGGSGASRSARVATAIENTFASIAKKSSRLEAAGIKVQGRDQFDVLFDIIRKTGGNETKLREVFSQQAMRGVLVLANEYKKTGGFGDFESFRNISPDATLIDRDFATRSSTGASKLKAEQIRRSAFFDRYIGGIAEFSAAHATEIQAAQAGLGALGTGLSLASRFSGKGGGAGGGALSFLGAQRVFVVNWPGGFGGGGTPGLPGADNDNRLLSLLGKAGLIAGAGVAGYAAGTYIDEKLEISDSVAEKLFNLLHPNAGGDTAAEKREKDRRQQIEQARAAADATIAEAKLTPPQKFELVLPPSEIEKLQKAGGAVGNINITINDEEVRVEDETGTRSPKVIKRRSAGGG